MRSSVGITIVLGLLMGTAQSRCETASNVRSVTLAQQISVLRGLGDQAKWASVLDKLQRLRKEYPESSEIFLFEVAANKQLGRNERCQELAREFLEKFPDSVNKDEALFLLGSTILLTGPKEEAVRYLKEASRETNDATLKREIQNLLPPERNPLKVGIRLGGTLPKGPEEIERARKVRMRILKMALEEYREVHGKPPERLDDLLQGDPPILAALPEDPANPGRPLSPPG